MISNETASSVLEMVDVFDKLNVVRTSPRLNG